MPAHDLATLGDVFGSLAGVQNMAPITQVE